MSRTVSEIMNAKLLYIREGDRLSLARGQILRFGVTAVPVLDDGHRPVGVVSLRDLAADGEEACGTSPAQSIPASATVDETARALAEKDLHHLVVVDGDGVAVGMVSALDVLRALVGMEPKHPAPFAGV